MQILRKLVFTLLTFSTGLYLLHASDAEATYNFSVKVVNKSGGPIMITDVKVKRKAGSTKTCQVRSDQALLQNGSSTAAPYCIVPVQKWQRQIRVRIYCDYTGDGYGEFGAARTLNFPRGSKKFFARDHAQKNGDKYVVRIKASDC